MRTHLQIIEASGGYRGLANELGLPAERVRFWERRKSIPIDAWRLIEERGVATRAELLDAAEAVALERGDKSEGAAA